MSVCRIYCATKVKFKPWHARELQHFTISLQQSYSLILNTLIIECFTIQDFWLADLWAEQQCHCPCGTVANNLTRLISATLTLARLTLYVQPTTDNCHINCGKINLLCPCGTAAVCRWYCTARFRHCIHLLSAFRSSVVKGYAGSPERSRTVLQPSPANKAHISHQEIPTH